MLFRFLTSSSEKFYSNLFFFLGNVWFEFGFEITDWNVGRMHKLIYWSLFFVQQHKQRCFLGYRWFLGHNFYEKYWKVTIMVLYHKQKDSSILVIGSISINTEVHKRLIIDIHFFPATNHMFSSLIRSLLQRYFTTFSLSLLWSSSNQFYT